ncbi:MAG: DUF169 domain-containing protein [Candidatus Hydrogenedentes bacterium]|nr:DUF169 domain-containing protein [Candidatus Hydrogenedentota bacterium]
MNIIQLLESKVGGRWTGVSFHKDGVPEGACPARSMRFCEAVKESSTGPLVLTPEFIDCPGALRSLGWGTDLNEMASLNAERTGVTVDTAREIIADVPHLDGTVKAITIGDNEFSDIVLSYVQPETTMKVIRRWEQVDGRSLTTKVAGTMAVCGSVAVAAYLTGQVCLSFGCPDSRFYGHLGRDQLVIGMPVAIAEDLFLKERNAQHAYV